MTIETKNKNYVSIVILHLYSLHHLRHIVAFHSVLPPLEEEQQTDTVAYGQALRNLLSLTFTREAKPSGVTVPSGVSCIRDIIR